MTFLHRFYPLLLILFLAGVIPFAVQVADSYRDDVIRIRKVPKRDRIQEAFRQEFERTRDPKTLEVPREKLIREYEQFIRDANAAGKFSALPGMNWYERGPANVGGRTRALMFDPADPTGETVFAGSVGGGIWKTTNISNASPNWAPLDDLYANLAVTTIAYDRTNPNIMYFGTGEGWFNADAIRGDGIWKSINGGTTFSQLASTASNANFRWVSKIVVHPLTGDVFAATTAGVFRSQNGGTAWTKVLGIGTGSSIDEMADLEIAADNSLIASTGRIFSGADGIYRSVNGNPGTWVKLNPGGNGFPTSGYDRLEIACAPSNANVIYVLAQSTSQGILNIYKTTNQGTTWTTTALPADADPGVGSDFTRGQAWYDMSVGVAPNDANTLIVGGIDLFRSTNGGSSWTQISHWYGGFGFQNVHADQHAVVYHPSNANVVLFGNDGGVQYSPDGGINIIQKSYNYNVTQYYACAINPTAASNQFMAGAQDNGTQQYNGPGINNTIEVTGGDGAYCHIDQNQPQYQFSSYVYNNIYRSTDGGNSFNSIRSNNNGSFINPSDFDDAANVFYGAYTNGNYTRLLNAHTNTSWNNISIAEFNGAKVTAVKVSPVTPNRVFFGLNNGRVVRVDNAHAATPNATWINNGAGMTGSVSVSSIDVERDDDSHLLVTYSNYGWPSVWETKNGGTAWINVEGNLPDMPVRSVLFSPIDSSDAIIATELGVWSTTNLNGASTVWGPANNGLANVRTDMLDIRSSDNMIIAATHGRGLYSSDLFAPENADFAANKKVVYINKPVVFTDGSTKANSWLWNFGDGFTSTLQNPVHGYNSAGNYTVTLTINGNADTETKVSYITVLPDRGTPYTPLAGGNFDVNPNDFAGDAIGGTNWQRGSSVVAGKDGVRSGANAWVTNLAGNYSDNATAYLYTPNYNFTAAGTYTLRFYRKNKVELGWDGYRVEYSINKGDTWFVLGTTGAQWYDFANAGGGTAFATGPFFNSTQNSYSLASRDVSFLAGNANIAFRFVFQSDVSFTDAGVAIDDFEIIGPTNVSLPVSLAAFDGKNKKSFNLLTWTTLNESNNDGFFVQRSSDGFVFDDIGFVDGNGTTTSTHKYIFKDENLDQPLYYYKLRQVDFDGSFAFSSTIAIRSAGLSANWVQAFPLPLRDELNLLFNEPENERMQLSIYSAKGDLIYSQNIHPVGVTFNLPISSISLAPGVYFINLKAGDRNFSERVLKY